MKRFLIHVSTHWCGEEDTFRAVAESESDLWDLAEQLAYDNFYSYGHDQDIAEEEGYDPDEMEESDWDELWSRVDENAYYSSSIEECEDDEEWNEYSGEIYGAWEDFVDFFTSEKETASGTPYIDCYDIRELFENGDV